MREFLSEEKYFQFKVCLFAISYLVLFALLWPNGQIGKLLFLLYVVITVMTLFLGIIFGLIVSLLYLFTIGSIMFYLAFQNIALGGFVNDHLTIETFVIYGTGLLITDLIAGSLHDQYRKMILERNRLRQEISLFVAVDPETSFDNAERMTLEVKREMNRITRYGGKFTILFLELDYYREFLKTYGQKEVHNLMKEIGKKVSHSLRFSDRKYRYRDNKFAFLLMETSKDNVEFVVEKLGDQLSNHQLLNGKTVTLSFHISFEEYNEQMKDVDYLNFIEELDKETIFYVL